CEGFSILPSKRTLEQATVSVRLHALFASEDFSFREFQLHPVAAETEVNEADILGTADSLSEPRLGTPSSNRFKALLGLPWPRRLARAALQIKRIRSWEKKCAHLADAEMRQAGQRLRGRARGGESLDKILPEAFGLVCV